MTPPCERGAGVNSAEAFDEDDITIDSPIHEPPPPLYRAVFRALTLLWCHYDLLIQARAAQRLSKIEMLAEDCVRQWSLAQATVLKLEQLSHEPNGYVTSARVAVDGAAQLLQPELRPTARDAGAGEKAPRMVRSDIENIDEQARTGKKGKGRAVRGLKYGVAALPTKRHCRCACESRRNGG